MAEIKTQRTKASVAKFIASVADETRRRDAKALDKMFREITGAKPAMWGPTIVGYGSYRYKYESGREGDWMRAGFSPRKANLVLYIMPGFKQYEALLKKLGKHKTGKSCLYITKLADVDGAVLRDLITRAWKHMEAKYG
jgi:nucleoid DNA-binding protein